MKLAIGENIKRLRRSKGMTQEQLAELLNVSCAAVSKWESSSTYPDITTIIPLASVFDVSVDELMGYDAARIEVAVEKVLTKYRQLQIDGKYGEARELIGHARKTYPNDYRIMHWYMWNLAGGSAANDPETLQEHYDEFWQICDCILSGCTDESLRLEAMTMKAKLLHAGGDTEAALEILSQFPTWATTAGQKTEQLFTKDTEEFRYWNRRNLYELADGMANKMIRAIWYEDGVPMAERLFRCETVGDLFTGLRKQSDENVFVLFEQMAFAELAGDLTSFGGDISDIIRVREKQLLAAKVLTDASKKDAVLRELLMKTYQTEDLVKRTVKWLKTSQHTTHVRLRENAGYMAMIAKYA